MKEDKIFALDTNDDTVDILLRHKLLRDLMYAVKFDDILQHALKLKVIKGKEVNAVKLELMNYYQDLDKPEFVIDVSDSQQTLIEKMDKFVLHLKLFAVQDDFVLNENSLNLKEENLKSIVEKYKIDDSVTQFNINTEDLKIMVSLILLYENFIISKPVFVMTMKNAVRNGESTKDLNKLITQMDEVSLLVEL